MNTQIIVLNSNQSVCQQIINELMSDMRSNFGKTLEFEFLHAQDISECQKLLSQHPEPMMILVDPKIAMQDARFDQNTLANLKIVEQLLHSFTNAQIVYCGDRNSIREAKRILTREGDEDRLVTRERGYQQRIVSQVDRVIARKSSDGEMSLNIAVMRLSDRLTRLEALFEGHQDSVAKDLLKLGELDAQVLTTYNALFVFNPQTGRKSIQGAILELQEKVEELEIDSASRIVDVVEMINKLDAKITRVNDARNKAFIEAARILASMGVAIAANSLGVGEFIQHILK